VSTEMRVPPIKNEITAADGATLVVRPIEITDVDRLVRMFGRLSRESIYFRFFSPIRRLPSAALLRLANVDHRRRDALVALDGDEIVAVTRYDGMRGPDRSTLPEAEIAVTVDDAWQHLGVGESLTRQLAAVARDRGFTTFVARILPENRAALGLMRKLSPHATVKFDGDYEARVPLASVRAPVHRHAHPAAGGERILAPVA
jgi:GNAT superfamily N-acetyltransferase